MNQLIAMSQKAEGALDLLIGLAAAVALGLIWVHVYRPHKLKRVAVTLGSVVVVVAALGYTYLWYAFNYMMDMS